jgi:hypothetical protein
MMAASALFTADGDVGAAMLFGILVRGRGFLE